MKKHLLLIATSVFILSCNNGELERSIEKNFLLKKQNDSLQSKLEKINSTYIFDNSRIKVEQDTSKKYKIGDQYELKLYVVSYNEDDYLYPKENDSIKNVAEITNENGIYNYKRVLTDTVNYIQIDFSFQNGIGKKIQGSLHDKIKADKK